MIQRTSRDGVLLARAFAVFLGAFLLFQVQPIVAKTILPWFGGAPAVWTTCVVFFQALLVVGYAYGHWSIRKLGPKAQGAVHLTLVVAALLTLPIAPDARAAPDAGNSPVLAIVSLLARSVALPYLVLAASTPLFQAWSSAREHEPSTYRLYALSNAGSLLGLVAYPFAIEPWLATQTQARVWSAAFAVFAAATAVLVRGQWRAAPVVRDVKADPTERASERTSRERLLWLALPACASALLLAVTNQMCQEVAVVPLLWVVPLALYLLSFVLCFESDRWYARSWCLPVLIVTLAVVSQAAAMGARVSVVFAVPVYSLGLFVCCMFCHGELAARRPATRHLTGFYLAIAVGGALGGGFVSLLAPILFRGYDELHVALFACGAFAIGFVWKRPTERKLGARIWHPALPALITVVVLIGAVFVMRMLTRTQPSSRELRNFYGILRLQDLPAPSGVGDVRYLTHGGTRHGQQFQDPTRRSTPTTYYGRASGAGILLEELATAPPLRIGIVGLGAGVLAAYGRTGDVYRFYEINPLVIEVARNDFTFLGDSAATIEVVEGDARLELSREADQRFDVLALDAFSSDAIPVHLLTEEAFELYARHLAPNGVIALHVSTRYLDLGPVVAALAKHTKRSTWEIVSAPDETLGTLDARWILLAADASVFERPRIREAGHTLDLGGKRELLWTDDYSNLFQVLK
jgi:SAM-dependent methyltransferase